MSTLTDLAARSGLPFAEDRTYFEHAEAHMERQWAYYLWPRLKGWPKDSVVDLGCGFGRNIEQLYRHFGEVVGVDINPSCVSVCRDRFQDFPSVCVLQTDGASLPLRDGVMAAVYSFDSAVHFEPEVLEAYVAEFARVLRRGGVGLVHHSAREYPVGEDFRNHPHWRNSMTPERFAAACARVGLEVTEQEVIGWDQSLPECELWAQYVPSLDCLTSFRRP